MERSRALGQVPHSYRYSTYIKGDYATWQFNGAIERLGLLVWSETSRFPKRLRDVGGAEKGSIATGCEKVEEVRIFRFAMDKSVE